MDHRIRVILGVMTMKELSAFPNIPWLNPTHQLLFCVIYRTLVGVVLLLYSDTLRLFYCPN